MNDTEKRIELLPTAKYRARAVAGEFGKSEKQKDYCSVMFRISAGPHVDRKISAFLYFSTDGNTERSIESLRYCGCTFPNGDITNLEGIDKKEVELDVVQEEFEGKIRNKVLWINSGGAFVPEEQRMSAMQKASFKERMKAAVVGSAVGDRTAAQRGADNDEPPPFDDGDVPF